MYPHLPVGFLWTELFERGYLVCPLKYIWIFSDSQVLPLLTFSRLFCGVNCSNGQSSYCEFEGVLGESNEWSYLTECQTCHWYVSIYDLLLQNGNNTHRPHREWHSLMFPPEMLKSPMTICGPLSKLWSCVTFKRSFRKQRGEWWTTYMLENKICSEENTE